MSCVIFGAGKIARGFLGHLLYLSGIDFVFVEKADALCQLINRQGHYTVNILGNSQQNCTVEGAAALSFSEADRITRAIAEADVVFTAVGGKNLTQLIPFLAAGIEAKAPSGKPLNIITCENWKNPATLLADGLQQVLPPEVMGYFETNVGLTEAVIMRSAIEAPAELLQQDPLIVNVQDYWELPVDAARVRGTLPKIRGLRCMDAFAGFLERKFYTYNAANGTVSYLGALLGYERIADAAHDPRILQLLNGVYEETARALSVKHSIPFDEQWAFTRTSLRKLQDYTIVDAIERNARDPMRKLGPDDRLVGSARLVEACGIVPHNLCTAIAAAIFYTNEADESARQLAQLRRDHGIDHILSEVCRLEPNGTLGILIKEKIGQLQKEGYLHE